MKTGDIIKCNQETEHWYSTSKTKDVTYLAIYGGKKPMVWTIVLTQAYYDSVAAKLRI